MAQQYWASKPEGRVLKFRQRGSTFARPLPQPSPVEDLGKYEGNDGSDDYRHRMKMNAAGFAFALLLVVAGVWIADTMAEMRKNQDCVLTGRRGCTPVEVPVKSRW